MRFLENIHDCPKEPYIDNKKFLTLEFSYNEAYSVIVCGRTETAIKWAEKFLKKGFTTSIQFKEIPEELLPYRLNLRYISDDLTKGDNLGTNVIGAVATGDPELDQIMAIKLHEKSAKHIMSETPGRFVDIRFPEEQDEQKTNEEKNPDEDEYTIKLGVFEDESESRVFKGRLNQLKSSFPDFKFEVVVLGKYDTEKYDLNYLKHIGKTFQDIVNNGYNRSFNALFKEDIDLILVDGREIPNFYSPDIEFWPTLIQRSMNDIVALIPKGKENSYLEWPNEQKIYVTEASIRDEIEATYSLYGITREEDRFPDVMYLNSLNDVEDIYTKDQDSIFVISMSDFLKYFEKFYKCINKYNYKLSFQSLTPITLDGFTIGMSRRDNQSKALKLLKIASQKINSEQSDLFMFESIYKKGMAPYFEKFFDYISTGAFMKFDDKYIFKAYAENKHGYFIRPDSKPHETMEEAIEDMFNFMNRAIKWWRY